MHGVAFPCDMEPGMRFASAGEWFTFKGVARVRSRFAGKRRVRVLTREGASWVCERDQRFPVVVPR